MNVVKFMGLPNFKSMLKNMLENYFKTMDIHGLFPLKTAKK
jgi:hypothetical protein